MSKSMLENKYKLTRDQNMRFARSNLVRLVYVNSRFEGVNTTLPQTQTIIDGLGVDGVPIDDINIIVQLKRGWQYVINSAEPVNLDFMKKINQIVAINKSSVPGKLRTGSRQANTTRGAYVPPKVEAGNETHFIEALLGDDSRSDTDKALTLMYHLMRNQIFWDGNKRTATLAANKVMINAGAGLISVPLDKWPEWNKLIADYYFSGDMRTLKQWTYENGIQGVDL